MKKMSKTTVKSAPKMGKGGSVKKPAPITTAGGTTLNGKKSSNKMS